MFSVCGIQLSLSLIKQFLYECETWSVILKKEHRLKMLENTVLGGGGNFGYTGKEIRRRLEKIA
jgi:hypothetical protein